MAADKKPMLTVPCTVDVPLGRFGDLIVCAYEGGMTRQWAREEKRVKPPKFDVLSSPDLGVIYADYPLNPGGALVLSNYNAEAEGDKKRRGTLNLRSVKRGAQVMAKKYPRHWADFIAENDDAITGDVFVQCCLFGEVIYG